MSTPDTGQLQPGLTQSLAAISRPVVTTMMAVVVLETLLFGIFVVLLVTHTWLRLQYRSKEGSPGWRASPLMLTSLAIFSLCALHWSLTIVAFFFGFLNGTGSLGLLGLMLFYFQKMKMVVAVRGVLTVLTILVGYIALIYRTWVIWNRDIRVAVFPIALWLGQLGMGAAIAVLTFRNRDNILTLFNNSVFTANWVLMLCTNLYCTLFTAWKIWITCRPIGGSRAKMFMAVLAVLLESYAILAAWLVLFIVTHQTRSVIELAAVNLTPQIIGIVNTLILIRVGLQRPPPQATTRELVLTTMASMGEVDSRVTVLESKWL
ncbi:hypothetical protein MIND_00624900 [Mycena indigotica]|uniref:Uncharacterized protein n=1 Tax=Mycena indigotica TaxID=2126181 RepID=A0A8H6ST80_9AGAR|nr:uncharacterized protein MIND_00624900 [Mycena indigotica]KAF7303942.1 hypothetical protein MIND_00624900 [Mycena indigotica]